MSIGNVNFVGWCCYHSAGLRNAGAQVRHTGELGRVSMIFGDDYFSTRNIYIALLAAIVIFAIMFVEYLEAKSGDKDK